MNFRRALGLTLALSASLLCTGCGAGGGGGGDAGDGGSTATTFLGTSDLLGTAVTVTSTLPLTAGTNADFQVALAGAGAGTPERLEVFFGNDYETSVEASSIATSGPNTWNVTIPLPATLASDASVLVRVILTDGNVLESGREDFLIAGR